MCAGCEVTETVRGLALYVYIILIYKSMYIKVIYAYKRYKKIVEELGGGAPAAEEVQPPPVPREEGPRPRARRLPAAAADHGAGHGR